MNNPIIRRRRWQTSPNRTTHFQTSPNRSSQIQLSPVSTATLRNVAFIVFLCVSSWLSSITWHIKQDGSGDFTTIQAGIDASTHTDTVLVYPGTFFENIIYNGKNITVASIELTTGDPSYVPLTVINGQQMESCVRVRDQETTAKLQGFTLINGWGSQHYNKAGGGIFVKGEYQSPTSLTVVNCRITDNYSESGGGIYSFRGNITLSGVSIHSNYGYINGGGIHVNDTVLNFDPNNRCNIYNNLAATGVELYSFRCQTNHVIVDTFTVIEPTRYFANQYELVSCPNPPFSFDILNYTLEPVNQDLYVSPYGNDANSGLSPDEPIKTIVLAIRRIASDSLNPKTVHLAAGVYSKSLNDQFFAFGGKDNVKIIGDSKTSTIIDGEYDNYCLFFMGCSDNSVLKNMTFQNITSESCMVGLHDSNNTLIENVIIQNYTGTYGSSAFSASPTESMYLKNVDIKNCTDVMFIAAAYLCQIDYLEMIDCTISNNTCSGSGPDPQLCAGIQTTSYANGEIVIRNTKFVNNLLEAGGSSNATALSLGTLSGESGDFTISNCLFADNQCAGTANKIAGMDGSGNVVINNTSFINNTGNYTLMILRNPIEFHNNIMRNNCNYEIFLPDNSPWGYTSILNISHCNIQGGQYGIYNQNNANIVNWGEGNIDEDPLFLEYGDDPYQLTEFSPCIDAGTPDTIGLFLPPWDMLHNLRVWDGDGNGLATIDMGCYEYGSSLYSGFIAGLVTNQYGEPLECAEITAGDYTTTTDDNGEYEMEVPTGNYSVSCFLNGYITPEDIEVSVSYGAISYADFLLLPGTQIEDSLQTLATHLTNYPNPFNPSTIISFSIEQNEEIQHVEIIIYNIKGQKVKTLMDCTTAPGRYNCIWDGRNDDGKMVASGEYLVKLQVNGEEKAVRKILLVK